MDLKDKKNENGNAASKFARIARPIIVDPKRADYLDESVIRNRFYNAMNCSALHDKDQKVPIVLGITSAGNKEGKTLTAANLAVSYVLGHKRKTVIVDMNRGNPGLHRIFGAEQQPGLTESIQKGSVFLSQTKIDGLYLLAAGRATKSKISINDYNSIGSIINILKKEFEIIILDMSAVHPIDEFPSGCVNETDKLMIVVDSKKTKYNTVKRAFTHIKPDKISGFILNNVEA